jgi:soluble P-type ATPase
MKIDIPGRNLLTLDCVVLDFNGTLALDGHVSVKTEKLLKQVAVNYSAIIATADTFGTATKFADRVGMALQVVRTGSDKEKLIHSLTGGVAVIGNGVNDARMFMAANLAIGVMGPEGAALLTLLAADILVSTVDQALELLIHPTRIVATLRK